MQKIRHMTHNKGKSINRSKSDRDDKISREDRLNGCFQCLHMLKYSNEIMNTMGKKCSIQIQLKPGAGAQTCNLSYSRGKDSRIMVIVQSKQKVSETLS
jgi:hypothetical protein